MKILRHHRTKHALRYLTAAAAAALLSGALCFPGYAQETDADDVTETTEYVTEAVETEPTDTTAPYGEQAGSVETGLQTDPTEEPSTEAYETTEASESETAVTTTTAVMENGWHKIDGKWYYYQNGRPSKNERLINGEYYLFATNGVLKTGWQTVKSLRKYYDYETGQPVYGWIDYMGFRYYCSRESGKLTGMQEIDGNTYIFNDKGILQTGFTQYGGSMYYGDETGAVVKGNSEKTLIEINGNSYVISPSGRVRLGWQDINGLRLFYDYDTALPVWGWVSYNGCTYYTDMDSGKYIGDHYINEHPYRFDSSGIIMTGLQTFEGNLTSYYYSDGTIAYGMKKIDGDTYYFGADGYMCYGWQTVSLKQYYFLSDGKMALGLQTIDGNTYYFGKDGAMKTGLQAVDNTKYYFDQNGIMQTGWQTIDSKKYYFADDGKMTVGWLKLSSSEYYFSTDGIMQTGFTVIDGDTYYFSESGEKQTGWQTIKNEKYYFGSDGVMYTYRHKIDGKNYCFYSDGAMVKDGNQDIAALALTQLGNEGGRPYLTWYGFSYRIEWCACFVSWCAAQCGYTQNGDVPIFISCKVGIDWFKEHNQWKGKKYTPITGDYIFFDWEPDGSADHIGIVDYVEDGFVYTIEGNSSDKCRQKVYKLDDSCIFGYASPGYP